MNQILRSSFEDEAIYTTSTSVKSRKNYFSFLRYQFYISIIVAIFFLFVFYVLNSSKAKKEKYSQTLLQNYEIATLYSTNTIAGSNTEISNNTAPSVIGTICIDKIQIYYPILSTFSEENLKISPCRFSGPLPNEIGNLCIAGHNYVDNKFFSRLNELSLYDSIWISDLDGNKLEYKIYKKYEVSPSDLSCLENSFMDKCEITLITCNNVSGNRLILKAIS